MPSMSREISAWVETLTFEDLPPNVVDRAKGVTLQALSSALLGHEFAEARQAVAMMQEEEAGGGGAATCLVTGTKLTKAGAALVNAETIFAGGKWDTFRMLTHPGCAIIPAALAAAEVSGANGKTFLTGVAAGAIIAAVGGAFIADHVRRVGLVHFTTSAAAESAAADARSRVAKATKALENAQKKLAEEKAVGQGGGPPPLWRRRKAASFLWMGVGRLVRHQESLMGPTS